MTDVIIAVTVVGSIGLIAGIILALAAHFFEVKTDDTVARIRDVLPGANCGGCGYSGCDGYASAVKNGAPCNLCAPGGADTATALARIMGTSAEAVRKQTAVVMCRGTSTVTGVKFNYDGTYSCKAVLQVGGGDAACSFGCLGYGDCERVCDNNAIKVVDGVARVCPENCSACGKCVRECPRGIISLVYEGVAVSMCKSKAKGADTRKVCTVGCLGCKKCEKLCPSDAIRVQDNCAIVDYTKCTACGACIEGCPVKAIHINGI